MYLFAQYLRRQVGHDWLRMVLLLLLLLLTLTLLKLLFRALSGDIPLSLLWSLLLAVVVDGLPALLPIGFFFAVIVALGRLYRDSEMVVLAAAGIGPGALYRALAVLALVGLLAAALFAHALIPWSQRWQQEILHKAAQEGVLTALQAGRFQRSSDGKMLLFLAREQETGNYQEVFFLAQRDQKHLLEVASSMTRQYDADGRLYFSLRDGMQYIGEPLADKSLRRIAFEEHRFYPRWSKRLLKTERDMRSSYELWHSDDYRDRSEWQWRLSYSLVFPILLLAALPLARQNPRAGRRYGRLLLAIGFYFFYSHLLLLGKSWMAQGLSPAWLGLWWVHAAMALLALRFWRRQDS